MKKIESHKFFYILLFVLGTTAGIFIGNFTANPRVAEYEIELIDQERVSIKSNQFDRYYHTTFDSIEYYINIDNL